MRNDTAGDLISRSALLEKEQWYIDNYDCGCFPFIDLEDVENAPAVDAVELGNCDGCYWKEIGRYHKCTCCRRNRGLKDCYRRGDE